MLPSVLDPLTFAIVFKRFHSTSEPVTSGFVEQEYEGKLSERGVLSSLSRLAEVQYVILRRIEGHESAQEIKYVTREGVRYLEKASSEIWGVKEYLQGSLSPAQILEDK